MKIGNGIRRTSEAFNPRSKFRSLLTSAIHPLPHHPGSHYVRTLRPTAQSLAMAARMKNCSHFLDRSMAFAALQCRAYPVLAGVSHRSRARPARMSWAALLKWVFDMRVTVRFIDKRYL